MPTKVSPCLSADPTEAANSDIGDAPNAFAIAELLEIDPGREDSRRDATR